MEIALDREITSLNQFWKYHLDWAGSRRTLPARNSTRNWNTSDSSTRFGNNRERSVKEFEIQPIVFDHCRLRPKTAARVSISYRVSSRERERYEFARIFPNYSEVRIRGTIHGTFLFQSQSWFTLQDNRSLDEIRGRRCYLERYVTIAWICYIVGLLQPITKLATVLCYHFSVTCRRRKRLSWRWWRRRRFV